MVWLDGTCLQAGQVDLILILPTQTYPVQVLDPSSGIYYMTLPPTQTLFQTLGRAFPSVQLPGGGRDYRFISYRPTCKFEKQENRQTGDPVGAFFCSRHCGQFPNRSTFPSSTVPQHIPGGWWVKQHDSPLTFPMPLPQIIIDSLDSGLPQFPPETLPP